MASPDGAAARVLVVEDSPTQGAFVRGMLEAAGHSVTVVRSGTRALEAVPGGSFDVVLTDLHLPGMSGLELCRSVKALHRSPAVVVFTADREPSQVLEGLQHGADGFLRKGSLVPRLLSTVEGVLRRGRSETPADPTSVRFLGVDYQLRSDRQALLDVLVTAFEETVALARELERTQRRAAETRRGESNLRRLLEALPDALAVFADDRIVFENRALRRILGAAMDSSQGAGSLSSRAATEEDRETLGRVLRGEAEEGLAAEIRLERADGVVGTFKLTSFPIVFDEEPAVCLVATEVTELRAMQASLAHTDRLRSMGSLAAGIAHEINNPLTYVLHGLDDVGRAVSDSQKELKSIRRAAAATGLGGGFGTSERLEELQRQLGETKERAREAFLGARRIRDIVAELRPLSRVEHEDRRRPVDVSELCGRVVKLASHQIRHSARVELDLSAVPPVLANDGRLVQVLINLLLNASHAIASGGGGTIRLITRVRGGRAIVQVDDDGPGIPDDDRAHLFDPFFTTKAPGEGTGLGLWICRQIVEEHDGTLDVGVSPSGGALFTIELPVHESEEPVTSGGSSWHATLPPRTTGLILLVEDEPPVRNAIARLLRRAHDVVAVGSIAEARAAVEENPRFDAVLCDLMLKAGTGVDLHVWLEANAPELARRFVVVTGGAVTRETREFISSGQVRLLAKPVNPRELDVTVREVLGMDASVSAPEGASAAGWHHVQEP